MQEKPYMQENRTFKSKGVWESMGALGSAWERMGA